MSNSNANDPSEHYTVHCANEPCNCEVTAPMSSEAYCGDSCRNASDREEAYNCACGHSPCDTP
jgi:hypothetical protein